MNEPKYSLDDLTQFLDFAGEKGLLKRNTAISRKHAALKILGLLGDQEKLDLRDVDQDEAFKRFTNLQGTEFKAESLRVYQSRLKSALTDFFAFKQDPAGFRPSGPQRASAGRQGDSGEDKNARQGKTNKTVDPRLNRGGSGLVVPVPIREGLVIEIHNIPPDLTVAEAEKVASVIKAYGGGRD